MNLMCLLSTRKKNKILDELRTSAQLNKIQTIPLNQPTLTTSTNCYFLNALPEIPSNYEVLTRWDNYVSMYINWNPMSTVDFSQLKKQYGFVITIGKPSDGKNMQRNAKTITIVFSKEINCAKHLEWFNSCFTTPAEENAKKKMTFDTNKQKIQKQNKISEKINLSKLFQ